MYPSTDVAVARTGMMCVSALEIDCRKVVRRITRISSERTRSI